VPQGGEAYSSTARRPGANNALGLDDLLALLPVPTAAR